MQSRSEERQSVASRNRHFVVIAWITLLAATSWAAKRDKVEASAPTVRVATDALGYHPLSSFYLMARTSSSSLDYIDKDNLLFTFRATGLLKRLSECQPDDEDQLIRALVIHLPDGNVVRSAEWRMHDRGRYLWALGHGKFLVRQRDSLMTTGDSLQLEPYIESDSPIRLVKLSPDAHLLLVESAIEKHSAEEHRRLVTEAAVTGSSPPSEDIQLVILRVADRSVVARQRELTVGDVPLVSEGYLENLASRGDHWMVRYVPFHGEPSVMADIASSCRPKESALNDSAVFISGCSDRGGDHSMDAVSIKGQKLWSYRWDNHYIWPTTASSENGRRIAFSALKVARPVDAMDPIDESELQAQRVEVLDADTGRLELTQFASPILSAGQNYALSPDGSQFAVLRDNAIEIFGLPSPAPATKPAE